MLRFSMDLKMVVTISVTFSIGPRGGGDAMLTLALDVELMVAAILSFLLVHEVVEAPH